MIHVAESLSPNGAPKANTKLGNSAAGFGCAFPASSAIVVLSLLVIQTDSPAHVVPSKQIINARRANNVNPGWALATQGTPKSRGMAIQAATPNITSRSGSFNFPALSRTTRTMAKIRPAIARPSENETLTMCEIVSPVAPSRRPCQFAGRQWRRSAGDALTGLSQYCTGSFVGQAGGAP